MDLPDVEDDGSIRENDETASVSNAHEDVRAIASINSQ